MSFPIDTTIPNAPNDPADDQPKMKQNFANINGYLSVDHVAPGATNDGFHKWTTLLNQAAIPAGRIATTGTLYTKAVSAVSQLFYTPDNSTNEYQLTRTSSANFSTFGTYGVFGTVTANYNINGFWTFLPGAPGFGLVQMSGIVRSTLGTPQISPSTIVVTFPFNFINDTVIVSVSPICKAGGTSHANVASVVDGSVSKSGFTVNFDTSTTAYVGFYWTAIGV